MRQLYLETFAPVHGSNCLIQVGFTSAPGIASYNGYMYYIPTNFQTIEKYELDINIFLDIF